MRFLYFNYLANMDTSKGYDYIGCMTRLLLENKYKPDIASIKDAMKFIKRHNKCRTKK